MVRRLGCLLGLGAALVGLGYAGASLAWAGARRYPRVSLALVVVLALAVVWLNTAGPAGHEMRLHGYAMATATAAQYPLGLPAPNGGR